MIGHLCTEHRTLGVLEAHLPDLPARFARLARLPAPPQQKRGTDSSTPNRRGPIIRRRASRGGTAGRAAMESCREELSRIDVNLTSVLENPRQEPASRGFDMGFFSSDGGDQKAPSAARDAEPDADFDSMRTYLARIGKSYAAFKRSQDASWRRARFPDGPSLASRRCFEAVPAEFFAEDFDLSEPSTFQRIVLDADADQQEALGENLDLVEGALLQQISSRSAQFFDALDALEDARREVGAACDQVFQLRRQCAGLKHVCAEKTAAIPALQRRRRNLETLGGALASCLQVQSSRESIQVLLDNREWLAALDLIQSAEAQLSAGDLERVQALQRHRRILAQFRGQAAAEMCQALVNRCLGDEGSAEPLPPLLEGLDRCGAKKAALAAYAKRLGEEMRLVLRTVVGEYINSEAPTAAAAAAAPVPAAPGAAEDGESLATPQRVRALSPATFLACLDASFDAIKAILKRSKAAAEAIASGDAHGGACALAQRSVVALLAMRRTPWLAASQRANWRGLRWSRSRGG